MKMRPLSKAGQHKAHVVLSSTGPTEEPDATMNLSVDVVPDADADAGCTEADGCTDADVVSETDTGTDTTAEEEGAEHFSTVICTKNKMRMVNQQKRGEKLTTSLQPSSPSASSREI